MPVARKFLRLRHLSRLRIAGLLLVMGVTLLLGGFYLVAQDRSFLAEFETFGAQIDFTEDTARNTWSLPPGTLICRLDLARRTQDASPAQTGNHVSARQVLCEPSVFETVETERTLAVRWPMGTRIVVQAGVEGSLIADIEAVPDADGINIGADTPLPNGSRIVLPPVQFFRSGSLPFSGQVSIGAEAGAGQLGYLVEGRYHIRQTLPGRDNPLTVASGQFNRGDRVGFRGATDHDHATVYGFLSAFSTHDGKRTPAPFHLVAYTALGQSEMTISRFASRTTVIKPDWTDRAINDPWLLAATVLLTLAALGAGILADSMPQFSGGDPPARKGTGSEADKGTGASRKA